MFSAVKNIALGVTMFFMVTSCTSELASNKVSLSHGIDESSGGDPAYIIKISNATFYLDKKGGGLSSILDNDGVDWLGFHKAAGSGHKGEYRGFPNAIHKQDGSYFHAMNATTLPSSSAVNVESPNHVRITFTSENKKWQGQWDFYPEHCDFTMTDVSAGYKYWVLYEGVPGGEMNDSDYWYSSADKEYHPIKEDYLGDLPAPEWFAFGDESYSRMLFVLHHEDDEYPDDYVSRPDMTVLGFGRSNKDKYLDTPQRFSIGFIETTEYQKVESFIKKTLNSAY